LLRDKEDHGRSRFFCLFVLKILFSYLRESMNWELGAEEEGQADSLLSGEPDSGLDLRTL